MAKPVYPSGANLPAIIVPPSDEVNGLANKRDLRLLGNTLGHALGFVTALLEHLTHRKAMEVTGLSWSNVAFFKTVCPEFQELMIEVKALVDERRVEVLEDSAYNKSIEGAKLIPGHLPPSDTMHKVMLSALNPSRYGKEEGGQRQAVQVNITL
jgi:hypothetical protein